MKAEVLLQRLLLAGALLEGATAMALLIYPSAAVGMLLGQPLHSDRGSARGFVTILSLTLFSFDLGGTKAMEGLK